MANRITNESGVINMITTSEWGEQPLEIKQLIADALEKEEKRKDGIIGRLFGSRKEMASIYVAFSLCAFVAIIFLIDLIYAIVCKTEMHREITAMLFPSITATLGYIFGKNSK